MRSTRKHLLCILALLSGVSGTTLTLSDAERRASEESYDVRMMQSEERAREWEKRNSIAGYLPSVSYGVDYTAMDPSIIDAADRAFSESFNIFEMFGPLIAEHSDSARAQFYGLAQQGGETETSPTGLYEHSLKHSITVTQPITNGGAEILAIRAGNRGKKAVEIQLESARQEAIHGARRAYFGAILASEAVVLSEENLTWATKNLSASRIREAGGMVPHTDVLQWEAEVVGMEGSLVSARAGKTAALLALYLAIGVEAEDADTTVTLQPLSVFEEAYDGSTSLPEVSPEETPAVMAMTEVAAMNQEIRRIALTGFLPKINAFGSYSWPYYWSDNRGKLRPQDQGKGWTAGITGTVPLFTSGKNLTNYHKVKHETEKVSVQLEQVRSGVALSLSQLSTQYPASRASVEASRKRRDLMERQLRIMQERYEGGLVNQTQLLDVARGAHAARLDYVQKLFDSLLLESEYLMTAGALEVSQ